MAVFHGKSGKVDFGGAVAAILNWTMSVVVDVAESTYMGLTWKTFAAGFVDATASVDANAKTLDTIKVGTNAELKLYIDATNYFTISTAVCTEQTETVSKDDVGKISYSFSADDIDYMAYA